MKPDENYWQANMLRMTNEGDVDFYISTIPSPYGLTYELYHNKTHNVYVRVTPASGSNANYIVDEKEAQRIMDASEKRTPYEAR